MAKSSAEPIALGGSYSLLKVRSQKTREFLQSNILAKARMSGGGAELKIVTN